MKGRRLGLAALLAVVAVCFAAIAAASDKYRCNSYQGKEPPELVSMAEHWMNTARSKPVTLKSLHGKVVWLQFNF